MIRFGKWLGLLLVVGCAARPAETEVADPALDDRIQREVEARLVAEPIIEANRIRVEVRGARVQLHGSVDGMGAWRCALRNAALVEDVRSVVDFLMIERGPAEALCRAPR